jgi:hypothetical protein
MSELTTQTRPPSGRATPQKKGSYEGSGPSGGSKAAGGPSSGSGFEGYYGADENHWWDDETYNQTAYYDNGYYDEYGEGSGVFEIFEVDLYSMFFVLDENLEPKDIYTGFEIDGKSLVFSLEADEIQDQMPQAWRSAPLKIHPEPVIKPDKKDTPTQASSTVLTRSASTGALNADANEGGGTPVASNVVSIGGSPAPGTQGKDQASQSDAAQTPKSQSRTLPEQSVATIASTVVEEIASGQQSPTTPGDASDSRNPRIVISSSQLEHLKLKMQVLKQRRGGSDEALPTTAEVKEASPAARTPTSKSVFSNCPGCHGLRLFNTPDPGWWCSVCEKEHPQGASFYGCRTCDYDECEKCAMTPRPVPDEKKDSSSSTNTQEKSATVTAEVPAQSGSTSNRTTVPSKATRKANQKTSASSSSSSAPAPATRRTATAVATRSRSRSGTRPGSTSDSGPSPSPSPAPSVAKKKKKKSKDEAGKKASKKEESKKESKKTESKKEASQQSKTTRDKVKVKKKVTNSRHASKNATKSSDEDEDPPEKEPSKKKVKKVREVKRSTKETKAAAKTTEKTKTDDRRDSRSRRGASASSASSKRSRRETAAVAARREGSSDSEEDPPPRKRAANTLTTERDASRNTPAVNLLRAAPVTSRRDETSRPKLAANDEVGPTRTVTQRSSASDSARTQTTLRRNSEPDLLRRVLRAQATQAPKRAGGSKEGEPRATLLPPSARKDADAASPPRGPAATLRPPNRFGASGGSKKADMKVSRRG